MIRSRQPALFLLFVVMLSASACSSSDTSATTSEVDSAETMRQQVIVDYSPTVSDVGALLYLLSHSGVDVLAVTLPVTGESGCELGLEVTLGILAMFERDDVPVACDAERPPDAEEWPVEFLAGHGALSSGLPAVTGLSADQRPAHLLIADIVGASEQPVVLFAVAPLTNVARALDRHPDLVEQLDRIVIMGGAVDAPGNVRGTAAEWNFWIDVPAAATVLASGVAISLVPLDATEDVPIPATWQGDLRRAEQNDPIAYLGSLVDTFPAVTGGFFYLWDELAATLAAGEGFVVSETLNLTVAQESGPSHGATVRDPSGSPILVATGVRDPASFYRHFLAVVAGSSGEVAGPATSVEGPAAEDSGRSTAREQTLATWLVEAFNGNVEAAADVVAPGAIWRGFGQSPDVFVEGSTPYDSSAIDVTCMSEALTICEVTWDDVWIAANPDLDRGWLRVGAEVADGRILAFREFTFDPKLSAAYGEHLTWLGVEDPGRYEEACGADEAAKTCSELLVATVADWLASR